VIAVVIIYERIQDRAAFDLMPTFGYFQKDVLVLSLNNLAGN